NALPSTPEPRRLPPRCGLQTSVHGRALQSCHSPAGDAPGCPYLSALQAPVPVPWITAVSVAPLKSIALSVVLPHRARVVYPLSCRRQSARIIHRHRSCCKLQLAADDMISLLFTKIFSPIPRSHYPPDTVGERTRAEMCVSHIPCLQPKKPGKLTQE